jgi:sulfur transfer complex TusBCD TusB component (DsrH family)
MVVDIMTKESKMSVDLEEIVLGNRFRMVFNEDNLVLCQDGKIKMVQRTNMSIEFEEGWLDGQA